MKRFFALPAARLVGAVLASVLAAALLAGCSGGQAGGHSGHEKSAGGKDFNAADAQFAADMIGHHREAITMADKALAAGTLRVRSLAERIKAAQDPEIDTMSGWLRKWGEDVPAAGAGSHHAMPGMASAEELASLEKATGDEADRLFLTLMIKHHEGALEMSADQQRDGKNPEARKLAGEIVTAQRAEIDEMRRMLG